MIPAIGFHLMEEVGEMAKEIRKEKPAFEEAVADVFAWIIALTMKLPQIVPLNEITWAVYPGVCKTCRQSPCECSVYPDTISRG